MSILAKRHTTLKAGGGRSSGAQDRQLVSELTPIVQGYIENIFKQLSSTPQATPAADGPPLTSLDQFMGWFQSPASSVLAPPSTHDLSLPLCNYYISSSHNTYLSGNQLYGAATTEAYTNVLLRGCRCLEIDVWNGEDDHSSGSSSDVEDAAHDKSTTPRRQRAMSRLKSIQNKAKDKLQQRAHLQSPSSQTGHDGGVGDVTNQLSATELAEKRAALKTEPRVYHGYTLTKDVPFRQVCEAIRDSAFIISTLPIIVSLEVHCDLDQQQVMVDIMEQTWQGHLVDMTGKSYDTIDRLPSPNDLRSKILVKVKWTPPANATETNNPVEIANRTSETGQADDSSASIPSDSQKKKASKVLEALSKLGVYTRAYSFKDFAQPEAKIPTHVFSLDENKLGHVHAHPENGPEMFDHNRDFLIRIYPSGLRVNSSNIDPAFSWRQGAQMVALNWQKLDKGMMLNEGMFAGEEGYVLKPDGFRSLSLSSQPQPVRRKLNLTIHLFAGQNIPLQPGENPSYADHIKPYVKFQLHVDTHGPPGQGKSDRSDGTANLASKYTGNVIEEESAGEEKDEDERKLKRKSRVSKTRNPDFAQTQVSWTDVPDVVEQLSFLRIKVMDDKTLAKDDLTAWACIRLDRLKTGYRFLHLLNVEGDPSDGVLLVHIQKEVRG